MEKFNWAKIYSEFRKSDKCWNIIVNESELLVTLCSGCNGVTAQWTLDNPENQPVCEDCYEDQ